MLSTLENVKVESIACCVPKKHFTVFEYANGLVTEKEAKRLSKGTGFEKLRISDDGVTTADLCYFAALKCCGENINDIDALIFVTQTPDYYLPATSHILQERLGLSKNTLCIDVNQGCAGYVYGLYLASLLVSSKQRKKVLLLAGDTISKLTSKEDRATRCIFGDAGTASIVTYSSETDRIAFNFETFGDRYSSIVVPNSRHRTSNQDAYLYLDGMGIMNFTLGEVPENIEELLEHMGIGKEDISLYACHQANKLILSSLATKLDVSQEKIPFSAEEIGNTSSASIPLLLVDSKKELLNNVLCCGFGVGLTVGSCIVDFSKTEMIGVFEYE